jgi:protein TonB
MDAKKNPQVNLENKKLIFRQIGAIIVLSLVFFAFEYKTNDINTNGSIQRDFINSPVEEIPAITAQPKIIPPPPPPVTRIQTIDNSTIETPNFQIDASINPMEELPTSISKMNEEALIDDHTPIIAPEIMPEFPGGLEALLNYLSRNIRYPTEARQQGIQGRVYLSFVIEKNGSVSTIEILRGIGGGCDEEAIRVVEKMPNWNPGKQNGRPVRVIYNLPVRFSLR